MSGQDRDTALDNREASAADRRTAADYLALEVRMAESEARAWRLLQAMPDPVVVTDDEGIIELINVQAVALFGYQPAELIGQPVERLIPAGLHEAHRAHRAAYVAVQRPTPMSTGPNIVAVRKDGTSVPVEVNLSAITLSTGRAVLASIRDVGDRKLADAELRISDERFQVSFDSAPIGMTLIDLHRETAGRFLRVNAAFCELTGYTEADLLGTGSAAITAPADRDETVASLERLVDGAATRWNTDKRYRHASGRDVWVHLAVSVVHDADARPSYGVSQVEDITGRKHAEDQMEERFRELATNVDVGFLLRGLDPPEYLYYNPAYLTVFGFDRAGPPPTPAESLAQVHPEDLDRAAAILGGAARGERIEQEWRFIRPDGQLRWVSGRISPISDPDGVVRRIAALFEDITARKNALAALEESEHRFVQLADALDVGITLRELGGSGVIYANRAFADITGVPPFAGGDINADPAVAAVIHPEDRERVLTQYWPKAAAGRAVASEHRIIRPDGQIRWIRATSAPVHDRSGAVTRVAGTVQDITEGKNAETALRESEKRFDQLARSTEVGFLLRTPTELLYTNPSLARIFGIDASKQPAFNDLVALVHPNDVAQSKANTAANDRGEHVESEVRIIRPDGAVRLLGIVTNPVVTPEGEENRTAITFTDITDRRAAEDELRAARADAEHANAAKDEFLSRMSHELRTPLNAVLGFAQLLELDPLEPGQQDAVRHILRGGRHLLAMIVDILDITGIAADRVELSPEPVAITELVHDSMGLMQPLAAENRITLRFDDTEPSAGLHVRADRRRLQQVLLNLLSNAIKYNYPDGTVDIALTAQGAEQLRIAVIDDGMGIAPEDLHRVFSPFDRLGRESSDIEGTGIGLALSQRLATIMGGHLAVEPSPGRGCTFTVTMPVTAPPTRGNLSAHDTSTSPVQATSVSTLLYVEDNSSNVDLLTSVLGRRPDWVMIHASTGRAGLALATTRPAVVLLDLHLPDISGLDVLRALKADPATADIPVAVLSADASPARIDRVLTAGAERYLTKPLDVVDVFAFLDTHMP